VRLDLDTVMAPATIATLPYGSGSHAPAWWRHLLDWFRPSPPPLPPALAPWVRHAPAIAIGPMQPRSGRPGAPVIDDDPDALLPDRERMVSDRGELRALGRAAAVGLGPRTTATPVSA
jgi:hypothetical protein